MLVDVTGIEPVTPCLQSIGLDSIRSIHYFQPSTFPTNRGTCFSLDAIPNGTNTLDSCTVRAQQYLVGAYRPACFLPMRARTKSMIAMWWPG
jgi:hypothetical protein